MKRRVFLISSAILAAGVSAFSLARWTKLFRWGEPTPLEPAESTQETGPDQSEGDAIFTSEDEALLFAVADLIVPREGDLPAASEIDLIPRLERWARTSEARLRLYRRGWPGLRDLIHEKAFQDGELDSEKLGASMQHWFLVYRRRRRGGPRGVPFFEQLRRDILRVYYSSPAGWAVVGYSGPGHRSSPLGEPHG